MKKHIKKSIIGLLFLGITGTSVSTLVASCSSNHNKTNDNSYDDNNQFNPPLLPSPPNELTPHIELSQIEEIRRSIDDVFSKITININETNLEQALNNNKNHLKQALNDILNFSNVSINDDDFITLYDKPQFDHQGNQNLNILIKLTSDCLPILDANNYNVQIIEKQNSYYLLVKNVITGFNQNDNGVEEPEIPSNSLSDNQLGDIRAIINKYFNPLTIKVTTQNINSVLNEKQNELKTELQTILKQTNINITNNQNFLILVDGENMVDENGYQSLSIGIKLNGNKIPQYNINNKYHISIENNNGLRIVLANVSTSYKVLNVTNVITQAQISSLATIIKNYFKEVNNQINNSNINQITPNQATFRTNINNILNESNISISNDSNIFKLLNDELHYDSDGYQIIDLSIKLDCNGTIQYPIDNIEKINFNQEDGYYYLSIKNIATGYFNPNYVYSLTNEQLTNINVTLNKYFNVINTDVNADQINSILGNQQHELKKELNNILSINNFPSISNNDFLIMWDGNNSKEFNSNGYLSFKVGIYLNVTNCPQYDLHNNANVSIQTINNKWYAITKVTTNYQSIISIDLNHAQKIKKVLEQTFNHNIHDETTLNAAKITATNKINEVIQDLGLQVDNLVYEIITKSPVTLHISISFNLEFKLNSDVHDFNQTESQTIEFKTALKTNYYQFASNTDEYFKSIKPRKLRYIIAQSLQSANNLPYQKADWKNPYDSIYNEIFAQINCDNVKYDFISWLKTLVQKNSKNIKIHIDELYTEIDGKYLYTSFSAKIYNNSLSNTDFTIFVPNNRNETITLKPNEIIDFNIRFNHLYHREFKFDDPNNTKVMEVGYYIENVSLDFSNHNSFDYAKFYFGEHSEAIKTDIEIPQGVGYFDIAEFGNNYLNGLDAYRIKQNIIDKNRFFDENFATILGSLQHIMQEFSKDRGIKDYFTIVAPHFRDLLNSFTKIYKKQLYGVGFLFEKIINRSNLIEILMDSNVKAFLYRMLANQKTILDFIYKDLISADGTSLSPLWNTIFKFINFLPLNEKIKNILIQSKSLIEAMVSRPVLDVIIENANEILNIIKENIIKTNIDTQTWNFIVLVVNKFVNDWNTNKFTLDIIYDFIKTPIDYNYNNEPMLIHLLKTFNVQKMLIDVINKLFVNNSHFSKTSIVKLIQTFFNMNEKENMNYPYDYANFYRNELDKNINFELMSYNPNTHDINIKFNITYINKKDIWFQWKEGFKDIALGWKVFEKILGLANSSIKISANSKFVKTVTYKGKVDYIVMKNQSGQYEMTWQLNGAVSDYEILAPESLKWIFNHSNVALKGFLIFAMNPLLFGKHTLNERYVADNLEALNNHVIIDNFNPTIPHNECVIVKDISESYYNRIAQQMFDKNSSEPLKGPTVHVGTYDLSESYTKNQFNYLEIKNDLFDLSNISSENNDYIYAMDSQILIEQPYTSLANFKVMTAKIILRFKSPMYFFDTKHQRYIITDQWTYNFFKFKY